MKIQLIDDWRRAHKFGTVRFSGALAALAPIGYAVRDTWNGIPDDLKQYLPASLKQALSYTTLGLLFIAIRYTQVQRSKQTGGPQ
ncbi:hypothetical protein [Burkholderia gladioli]|uniref:DUF7940 domain-containing protein n=1 Tax=Burkholderia gladioli TaxID=28095 RepID=UPI000A4CA204|nr:hypothetical protein [Burkholderia gladioli]